MKKLIAIAVSPIVAFGMYAAPAFADGDVTVTNVNNGTVSNMVISSASTGGNEAGGSYGGDGGNGGSVRNYGGEQDVSDSTLGAGGNGGNGAIGGTIYTGDAGSLASVTNVINSNDVEVDRCACNEVEGDDDGNDVVANVNTGASQNMVFAKARTGWNGAEGSSGGEGGRGGSVKNGSEGSQNVDDTTTGTGGAGGNGGAGGYVETGLAVSETAVVNVLNTNVVRIRR